MKTLILAVAALALASPAYAITDEEMAAFRAKYHISEANNLTNFNKTFDAFVQELGGLTAGDDNCYKRMNGSVYCTEWWRGKGLTLEEITELPNSVTFRELCRFYYNQTVRRCSNDKGVISDSAYTTSYGVADWHVTQTVQFVWPE